MSFSAFDTNVDLVRDRRLQDEVADRALAAMGFAVPDLADLPGDGIQRLGELEGSDGTKVKSHLRHALDLVIVDLEGQVLLSRVRGSGDALALPRAYLDRGAGSTEAAVAAVLKDLEQAVGLPLAVANQGKPLGQRSIYRPFDVRVAPADAAELGIRKGDVIAATTQALVFVVEDLGGALSGFGSVRLVVRPASKMDAGAFPVRDNPSYVAAGRGHAYGTAARAMFPDLATEPERTGWRLGPMQRLARVLGLG